MAPCQDPAVARLLPQFWVEMGTSMMKTEAVIEHITGWLRDYCQGAGTRGCVVGVSGTIHG